MPACLVNLVRASDGVHLSLHSCACFSVPTKETPMPRQPRIGMFIVSELLQAHVPPCAESCLPCCAAAPERNGRRTCWCTACRG